jgi:hypothetical protein
VIPPRLSQLTPIPGQATGGVPGTPVSRAYGNPGVATNDSMPPTGWPYVEGNTGANVGPNQGPYRGGYGETGGTGTGAGPDRKTKQPGNQYGGDLPENHVVAPGVMNPPHTPWRGGADFANENTAYDRHVMVRNMEPRTGISESVPGNQPNPDAPSQGKPRPVFAFLNRAINPQVGSNQQWNQNQDEARDYSRVPDADCLLPVGHFGWRPDGLSKPGEGGRFAGTQGDGWTAVNGGVPGLYQPYGSYSGYTANAYGEGDTIHSPVGEGQPGDGPHKIFSGPPHGLHSQTYPSYDNTLGRYMAIPQQHAPRLDRPANSKIAGQDYSQTVQPQGETGTVSQKPARFTSKSRFGQ